jgi:DNA polymerase III alpha subunit (gram-positive type)
MLTRPPTKPRRNEPVSAKPCITATARRMKTTLVMHSCTNFKNKGSSESRHQACCVQAALHISNLYHHGQSQLQSMYHQLQATRSYLEAAQNDVEDTRGQILVTEQELQREREASELLHQQSAELQECHHKLLKEHESAKELQKDLSQSLNNSKMFADEVARRAESLVNKLQAKLAEGEVSELPNGQSISGMILESAKNALLVKAFSSQHPEEDPLAQLSFITDQCVGLQQHNRELSLQVETLSRQVEDGKKKPRRGKMSRGKK